jgi:hypothetical protein
MSSTSCYEMAPITSNSPKNMTTLAIMESLPSSIYEASLVTFVNDTDAYVIVDID